MANATTTKATTKKAAEKEAEVKEEGAKKGGRALPTRAQLDALPNAIDAGESLKGLLGQKRIFEKSGSTGYNINGKVLIGGLIHTVSCNIVAVGSKHVK